MRLEFLSLRSTFIHRLSVSLTAFLLFFFTSTPADAITGHARIGSCPEGGWECELTFEGTAGNDLIWAQWDFNGTGVWWSANGPVICPDHFAALQSWYEGFPHVADGQQWTLSQIIGFEAGESVRFGAPIYAADGSLDYEDLAGGTLQVQFEDGTLLAADFDNPTEWPYGAVAYFQDGHLPNLVPAGPPGWAFPAVPRPAADATFESVPAPVTLVGGAESTWLNGELRNVGTAGASSSRIQLQLDGEVRVQSTIITFPAGAYNGRRNVGPYTVSGGRHTLTLVADAGSQVFEACETDNRWARQWIWSPPTFPSSNHLAPAPPYQYGGTEDLGVVESNCDGWRIETEPYAWHAAWMTEADQEASYYLILHEPSTGPDHGFESSTYLVGDAAGGEHLSFVFLNTFGVPPGPYDVAVINPDPAGTSDYYAGHVAEYPIPLMPGQSTNAIGPRMMIFQVFLTNDDLGTVTCTVEFNPEIGRVHLAWLHPSQATGTSDSVLDETWTDFRGQGRLTFVADVTGYYGLVVWREPFDTEATALWGEVAIHNPLPDLSVRHDLAGWPHPVIPRPDDIAIPGGCVEPDTLHGNVAATYLNSNVFNLGPAAADPFTAEISLDGDVLHVEDWPTGMPGQTHHFLLNLVAPGGNPWVLPGGRHTLAMRIDPDDQITELFESDNHGARQFCWSPRVLAPGALGTRGSLPAREGGWQWATPDAELAWNCDGLRQTWVEPDGDAWWRAVAVVPHTIGGDVDCRLHEPLQGIHDGFGNDPLVESAWPDDAVDFVLVNQHAAPGIGHDIGVLDGPGNDGGAYLYQDTWSQWRGEPGIGEMGPFHFGPQRLIDLHELRLEAGPLLVRVDDLGGGIDWGLSLYGNGEPYYGKSDVLGGGIDWEAGPGESEAMIVEIPADGDYCLAVWRRGRATLAEGGDYRLWFTPGATPAPDAGPRLPAYTGFATIAPNPFNPSTEITFDLAKPARATVTLHDVGGRQLARLACGDLPAGRHAVTWNGVDSHGQRAASGVYFVRLSVGGEQRGLRKITLLK